MSSDVFIGKIGDKGQSYDATTGPVDVYTVDASNPIMGKAQGPIKVGFGSVNIDGKPCRYGIQAPEPGQTYLLATKYNPEKQVFVMPLFQEAITKLTPDEVQKIGTSDEPAVVKEMREAVKAPLAPRI